MNAVICPACKHEVRPPRFAIGKHWVGHTWDCQRIGKPVYPPQIPAGR